MYYRDDMSKCILGATARAIAKAGGMQIVEECRKLGKTRPNGIAVTGAGDLPCRFIIHVDMHNKADWDRTIRAALLEAASLEVESVAIPAICTDAHVLSPSDIARKMLDALESFATHNVVTCLKMVRIVIFQASMLEAFRNYAKRKTTDNITIEPGASAGAIVKFGDSSTVDTSKKTKKKKRQRNRNAGRRVCHRRTESVKAGGTGSRDTRRSCNYRNACRRYFGTLGISGGFENSTFTICYCSQCHCSRGDNDFSDRGQPPKTYCIPIGWCRIGLHSFRCITGYRQLWMCERIAQ
ncbi:hypothetical protein LSAT2_008789 [Lamellibrachia satsuma]|nr:hypothetical protein LSAT2_008789 [Lamellibrachia satsuma]